MNELDTNLLNDLLYRTYQEKPRSIILRAVENWLENRELTRQQAQELEKQQSPVLYRVIDNDGFQIVRREATQKLDTGQLATLVLAAMNRDYVKVFRFGPQKPPTGFLRCDRCGHAYYTMRKGSRKRHACSEICARVLTMKD